MGTLWVRIKTVFRNLSRSDVKLDYSKVDLDLISNIFGTEEAKKYLLNVMTPEAPSVEQVLKDAQAMELMIKTYPWKLYEQAIWRRVVTELIRSLNSNSLEQREGSRHRAMAHLSDLHLPFELKWEADRIRKMRELTKAAQQQI